MREARYTGEAYVRGRLYDFGEYPGLVTSAGGGGVVHGEVFELANPEATFVWLDAFEGVSSPKHPLDEYLRCTSEARFPPEERCEVWIYLYRRPLGRAVEVNGGRWTSPIKTPGLD